MLQPQALPSRRLNMKSPLLVLTFSEKSNHRLASDGAVGVVWVIYSAAILGELAQRAFEQVDVAAAFDFAFLSLDVGLHKSRQLLRREGAAGRRHFLRGRNLSSLRLRPMDPPADARAGARMLSEIEESTLEEVSQWAE